MLRSLGNKRKEIHEEAIKHITEIYGEFKESPYCKIFDNDDFGYKRITVERPKRDENPPPLTGGGQGEGGQRKSTEERGKIVLDKKGNPLPDADLRDFENVSLKEDVAEYFNREVLPHVPDAWIDHSKTKVGYEINFTKYFYRYKPLRSLEEIRNDILALEAETDGMIKEVIE